MTFNNTTVNDIYSNSTNLFVVGIGGLNVINKNTYSISSFNNAYTYNAVFSKDSNIIAVGNNIISYSSNNGT